MWSAAPVRRRPALGAPAALRLGLRLAPGLRVGVYGGSFNPPHAGHAHVAETARRRLALDRVLWLVAPQNPLKPEAGTAGLDQRLGAARQLAQGPAMVVSAAEARLGTRYTLDTLRALRARFPGVKFVWIMGADSLASLHRWRGWTEILAETPAVVVSRPGSSLKSRFSPAARRFAHARLPAGRASLLPGAAAPAWTFLTAPLNPQSSTAMRRADAAGGG